jgi:hypothetical protein
MLLDGDDDDDDKTAILVRRGDVFRMYSGDAIDLVAVAVAVEVASKPFSVATETGTVPKLRFKSLELLSSSSELPYENEASRSKFPKWGGTSAGT